MDQEHEDYEDLDAPVSAIDSPFALLVAIAKTIGVLALSISAVVALLLMARELVSWLLDS